MDFIKEYWIYILGGILILVLLSSLFRAKIKVGKFEVEPKDRDSERLIKKIYSKIICAISISNSNVGNDDCTIEKDDK